MNESTEAARDAAIQAAHRARLWMWLAAIMLLLSLLTVAMSMRNKPEALPGGIFAAHVVVLGLVLLGARALTRLRKELGTRLRIGPLIRPLLAPWVLVLGLAAWAALMPMVADLGQGGFSMRTVGERHYLQVDHEAEREVSAEEYERYEVRMQVTFARGWAVFSFVALLQWRFVALAREAEAQGRLQDVQTLPRPVRSDVGWRSRALILALWTLMLVMGPASTGFRTDLPDLCRVGLNFEPSPWLALLPMVFFGVSALFYKHSPWYSAWLESWTDERYGAGAYNDFMVRLKPLLMLGVGGLSTAAVLTLHCQSTGAGVPFTCLFLAAGGLGFMLMHLILRLRKIPAV